MGVRTHPTCLAASWSACNVPPQTIQPLHTSATLYQQQFLSGVTDGMVTAISSQKQLQWTNGFFLYYQCFCLLKEGEIVGLMLSCSQQRTIKEPRRVEGHHFCFSKTVIKYFITLIYVSVFCFFHFFQLHDPTLFIKVVLLWGLLFFCCGGGQSICKCIFFSLLELLRFVCFVFCCHLSFFSYMEI